MPAAITVPSRLTLSLRCGRDQESFPRGRSPEVRGKRRGREVLSFEASLCEAERQIVQNGAGKTLSRPRFCHRTEAERLKPRSEERKNAAEKIT